MEGRQGFFEHLVQAHGLRTLTPLKAAVLCVTVLSAAPGSAALLTTTKYAETVMNFEWEFNVTNIGTAPYVLRLIGQPANAQFWSPLFITNQNNVNGPFIFFAEVRHEVEADAIDNGPGNGAMSGVLLVGQTLNVTNGAFVNLNILNPNPALHRPSHSDLYTLLYSTPAGWTPNNGLAANFVFTGQHRPRAVPEPEAWAMMIVGFGVVGATLRARRRHRVSVSFS